MARPGAFFARWSSSAVWNSLSLAGSLALTIFRIQSDPSGAANLKFWSRSLSSGVTLP